MKKRIIIYSHAYSSLGHIRRVTRVAKQLSKIFTVLVITGSREGMWMIPKECEFVYFPSWLSLRRKNVLNRKKNSWMNMSLEQAQQFRSRFLKNTISTFAPDAIIVDYLPFGLHDELRETLLSTEARKYLLLRGIIDSSDIHKYSPELSTVYNKILIVADKKIIDYEREYLFDPELLNKCLYLGYISPQSVNRQKVRKMRNVGTKKWVVCSCGGGKNAEKLIKRCIKISEVHKDVLFDIVCGPLTKIDTKKVSVSKNCTIYNETSLLSEFHASCDVLICTGGYNTILEGINGKAKIIVYPNQKDDDEQETNARKLAPHYPIKLVKTLTFLDKIFEETIKEDILTKWTRPSLQRKGLEKLMNILKEEL